ncbi:MAG: class I SAM-dependent methyltransferase [Myxococcota bacterium]
MKIDWDTVQGFPPTFFHRRDDFEDDHFYRVPRLVTHIDDEAIRRVGRLYSRLGIDGDVLDLMSSWISHFETAPRRLIGLGMNRAEMAQNAAMKDFVVHDLNQDPLLPFPDESIDHVVCCVSVDYLTRPLMVFGDIARILRPGGLFVHTFSNRCFPTKAIHGWLMTSDEDHMGIVSAYFRLSGAFHPAHAETLTPDDHRGDPLFGVWAQKLSGLASGRPRSTKTTR